MKKQQEILIEELKKDVETLLSCAESIRAEKDALLIQPTPEKWSVAQVLAHLNGYGKFYLSEIDKALSSSPTQRDAWFTSGFFGEYFTNTIRPKNVFEVKAGMKAPKQYVFDNKGLNPVKELDEFVQQQQKLLQLLELAKQKSLNSIRIPISLTRMIKLKLGDTFRFFIAHEQRHMIQARNALKTIGLSTDKFPAILQANPQ
jgi:uncharacterized damage-inducible protein DinB